MPITEEQRQERKRFIGASDVPALMNADPYRNIFDLWADKVLDLPPIESDALTAGTILQDAVMDWYEQAVGVSVIRDYRFVSSEGIFAANCDGVQIDNDPLYVVEAKTCAITGRSKEADEFGEPGTDQIPVRVYYQVQAQMMCAGQRYRFAHIPVLIGQKGFRYYVVDRCDETIELIRQRGLEFWEKYVQTKTQPPGDVPVRVLQYIPRVPDMAVEIDPDLVRSFVEAKESLKQAEERAEETKAAVLRALGSAEVGVSDVGRFTYKKFSKKEYTVKARDYMRLDFRAA